MTFLAPLAGAALSAGATALASKYLGPQDSAASAIAAYTPPGINAGGLDAKFKKNQYRVNANVERLGAVNDIASLFDVQGNDLAALRAKVAPGISELRSARLAEIENARNAGIGNLRDNLARRRVLGSSFGSDALARAESEFGQQRDRVAAESFLQELSLSDKLMAEEYGAKREAVNTVINEMNLEANLATQLAGKASDQLGANARTLSYLNTSAQQGAGQFFGQTFQPAAKEMTPGLSKLFSSFTG